MEQRDAVMFGVGRAAPRKPKIDFDVRSILRSNWPVIN